MTLRTRSSQPAGLSPTDPDWRPTPVQTPLEGDLSPMLPTPVHAVRRAGKSMLDAVVLLAVVAFAALAVGPHLLPYRPVTMLTGSMSPAIPAGAVFISSPVPREAVRVGDVITMEAPEGDLGVVSHRVIQVERRDGAVLVRTQGDANPLPDPWLARLDGDVMRASAVLPWVGHPLTALQGRGSHVTLSRAVPAVLLLGMLVSVWRRPTAPRAPRVAAPQ